MPLPCSPCAMYAPPPAQLARAHPHPHACPHACLLLQPQADNLLSLYHGEWKESVDPIYSPEFTY